MKYSSKSKKALSPEQKRSRKKKIVLAISIACALPIVVCALLVGGFAIWAQTVELDKSLLPTQSAAPTFFSESGEQIDYAEDSYILPSEVPETLKNAFVALEDKRFYKHKGYDIVRIFGATLNNIKAGKIKEGASTITQQLVKNTQLTHERTLSRKLNEIAIATKLEEEYSKDEILSMYLSVIYFGNGAYGVKSAARLYFAKSVDELSLGECAALAGIVKNPKGYSPFSNEAACINRRNLVLSIMKNEGYIDENEYSNAVKSPLESASSSQNSRGAWDEGVLEAYIKMAKAEVCDALNITKYQLENSGYKIYLNIDCELQKGLVRLLNESAFYEARDVDGTIVIRDNMQNTIKAYASTLSFEAYRQPGSVIKPLAVYAPAIDMGLVSLATPIIDEKTDFNGYSPSNFADKYYGETTIRQAIKRSMNTVAVKTMSFIGVDSSKQYLSRFGINTESTDNSYALALGGMSKGISALACADAYSVFANQGEYNQAHFVKCVVSGDRKLYTSYVNSHQAIQKSTADIVNSALIDTVRDGTAIALSALPFEICAKTGTAERADGKNSDAWCASYSNDYTVVVWHGSDVGMSEKGGGLAAKQCARVWQELNRTASLSSVVYKSDETYNADIDVYATKKNRFVTLASENTPVEYRKSEIFPKNQAFEYSTYFDAVGEEKSDFELVKNGSGVAIKIANIEPIYSYKIYRTDVLGEKLIFEGTGDEYEQISLTDCPLSLFDCVVYRVECSIKGNSSIKSDTQKSVYFEIEDFGMDIYG